jgi:uncharacterized OB-fold protein
MSRDYIDESNVDLYWEELMEEGQTTCPECSRVYAPKHYDGCPSCLIDDNYYDDY